MIVRWTGLEKEKYRIPEKCKDCEMPKIHRPRNPGCCGVCFQNRDATKNKKETKCIDCKHLFDGGDNWYCIDDWGNRVEIPDPFVSFHCDDFEPIEESNKYEPKGILPDENGNYPTEDEYKAQVRRVEHLNRINYDKHRELFDRLLEECKEFENKFC